MGRSDERADGRCPGRRRYTSLKVNPRNRLPRTRALCVQVHRQSLGQDRGPVMAGTKRSKEIGFTKSGARLSRQGSGLPVCQVSQAVDRFLGSENQSVSYM